MKASKKSSALNKAGVKAVKAGAKAAKLPGTMSAKSRNSSQMAQEFNAGYISGKKDISAAKRNAAKQTMKKMGKKK